MLGTRRKGGGGNENITVDHVGEGGVKQDITYLGNFLNFDSVEFLLLATRTPFITVEQSACNP